MLELVAPGGSYTKAMVAARYGADAVYLGVPYTSLRMRQNKMHDFAILKQTIDELHSLRKKAYLTMNIFPRNSDIAIFEAVVEKVSALNADAIIFSDPGTLMTCKKYMPNQRYHLSTQANTLNWQAVQFRHDLGVHRIVLARELTLGEIKEIKQKVPGMELEIFCHGAMCIAYSGRCLLGEYFSGRDGNKGECSHVCRYKFSSGEPVSPGSKEEVVAQLTEENRPGKTFDLMQDQEGTHMLSSKDLCTIERLDEILPRVDGIKIEGRSKGEFYVGSVCKAYKHVLTSIEKNTAPDPAIKDLVYQIPHRPYWDGFLFGDIHTGPDQEDSPNTGLEAGVTLSSGGPIVGQEYFGFVEPVSILLENGDTARKIDPKQVILAGMELRFLSPTTMGTTTVKDTYTAGGKKVEKITCNTEQAYLTFTTPMHGWEILYADPVNY